ncbi:ATP-dependent Clp protease ATP-binding subunit [Candidatus Azobacteroides pseudotrichonymphae genomovar. CFP2]|uniref:ATP-dependent Clp protease ATP-binding subunit n=2 Tax=Candidatus Azobacteroides TaxID=511434 RepID=B6YQD6_AZOPC|nr:ATP-dependent Clp protease ATP-binding subunit [Candidatus Azobacteroides pseudotrichonymphae genomovar. CFP2]
MACYLPELNFWKILILNGIMNKFFLKDNKKSCNGMNWGKKKVSIEKQSLPQMGAMFDDDEDDDDEAYPSNIRKKTFRGSDTTNDTKTNDTPVIDSFGIDLTKASEEGCLDIVIGREVEIERLSQILSRRKKNNPVLIGEPGVGKSAIVEGLASRIVQRKVSRVLFNKRVINLDMTAVVAGTKYRGQFEERIKAILNELSKNPNIILFIDEIHTIIGTGSVAGTMDAANILKPALARGEIQCIGATTLDEYRNIEKDGALERRFQKIMVEPTTAQETRRILENIKHQYEDHHSVIYTDEALDTCVRLTERYINDRNFPDKAIDAMDEVGAKTHISNIVVPKNIEELETRIEILKGRKLQAVKSQNFEVAAGFRDEERCLSLELEVAKSHWETELQENRQIVDGEKVAEVVAMMSGIPIQSITKAENQKLLEMGSVLRSVIIGQDEAVQKTVRAIQRNRIGLKDPNKPIGSFMFLGPTGVGKTYLAKKIAEYLFDSTDALIRVDMSEFREKFTVSRLVGAPPGYVGYEEGGQLTEKVRRRPYSVILFDEIEKAHADVFNLLLQVMDEGRLTDSLGRRIDFKNTVLIMTSNVGSRQLKDFGRGIGFTIGTEIGDRKHSQSVIQKALNKTFTPEFLNRIDDIILFDSLDEKAICQVVELELKEFYKRVETLGYKLNIGNRVKEFIALQAYDVQLGARPLKRAIQRYLEDELADMIIKSKVKEGDIVAVGFDEESKKIIMNCK